MGVGRVVSRAALLRRRGPQMLGSIGAPRTPRGGQVRCFACRHVAELTAQNQVASRERVGVAERAQGDVLDRPRTDAGQPGELRPGPAAVGCRPQVESRSERLGERHERRRSGVREPDRLQPHRPGRRDRRGQREVTEPSGAGFA